MTRQLTALAPAKINLGLEVLGRRENGYHDIVTVLQTVSVYDRLIWRETQRPFEYISPAQVGQDVDLVGRALAFATDRQRWTGRLRLEKNIPLAAGLGGGSSDAALGLKLAAGPGNVEDLHQQAASLGSDVPFFLRGGTALARGTGTELTFLPTPSYWVVLVTPDIAIPSKTRSLYQALAREDFSDGSRVMSIAESLQRGKPIEFPIPNAFERALLAYPAIEHAASSLKVAGAPWVSVSGSGPTLFTLLDTCLLARSVASRIPPEVGRVHLARTIPDTGNHAMATRMARLLRSNDDLR